MKGKWEGREGGGCLRKGMEGHTGRKTHMRENLNFLNALVWKISENINTGMILIVQRKTPVKQFNEPFFTPVS